MNCASKGVTYRFEGVPAHASTPELAETPAQAVAWMVSALPGLTRREDHRGLVMATVVQIDVGEPAFGISAYRGALLLTLRAQYQEELDALSRQVTGIARRAAEEDGLTLTIEEQDVFPETANHHAGVERGGACRPGPGPAGGWKWQSLCGHRRISAGTCGRRRAPCSCWGTGRTIRPSTAATSIFPTHCWRRPAPSFKN